MTKDEALKLALEALKIEEAQTHYPSQWLLKAITAIKEALAQPEQDIVQRLSALVRAQQLTIDKLEAQTEQNQLKPVWGGGPTNKDYEDAMRIKRLSQFVTPPQRKPLTDEELRVIENKINPNMRWRSSDEEGITLYPIEYYELVRAIEAAHGIKENT